MPLETQAGFKAESTYGTAVVVDRFMEFNESKIEPDFKRVEYKGLRSGQRVQRSDRFVPYHTHCAGPVKFNPLSKGFGFWLVHMLGSVATAGPTDSAYTHTGTIGSLLGDSFTYQDNRYDATTETNHAWTFEGCKVSKWELGCDDEGLLECSLDVVSETFATGTALASASYPSSAELFSFVGSSLTIAGTAVPVKNIKVMCDNGLDVGRVKQRSSALIQQPIESKHREITWEATVDYDAAAQVDRIASATASGAVASLIWTLQAPTLIGATAYPTVTVTVDAARFDSGVPTLDSEGIIQLPLKGRGLYDGTDSPVTIAYKTADATP